MHMSVYDATIISKIISVGDNIVCRLTCLLGQHEGTLAPTWEEVWVLPEGDQVYAEGYQCTSRET